MAAQGVTTAAHGEVMAVRGGGDCGAPLIEDLGSVGGQALRPPPALPRPPSCSPPSSLLIDRMRQWSIVGSVRPLHGPGRQRSHASAGQPGRPEGEDQLGPTTSHLGPCCRRTEDPADEPHVLY
jgi:hypothetical protein